MATRPTTRAHAQSAQVFALPPRPVQSFKPLNPRRPHKKHSKSKDKENPRAQERAPRVRNIHHQPLTDASNMTSLQYNSTPSLTWNLPPKPSFVIFPNDLKPLFTPTLRTPYQPLANLDFAPIHLPHLQPLRTIQVPQPRSSNHNQTGPFIVSDQKTNVTPKTRRKLAVEGVRKAVSDAALRKMGINAGLSWAQPETLDQPISFITTEKRKSVEVVDLEKLPSAQLAPPISPESIHEGDFQHHSYSPRQYTPKPLLLPCKLARSSNPTRSPPPFKGPLFSRQRTISYHRSPSPSDTGRQIQRDDGSMSDDECHAAESLDFVKPNPRCSTIIDDGSTTPSNCSFTGDPEIHASDSVDLTRGGSTTPCDTSFEESGHYVLEMASTEHGQEEEIESPERRHVVQQQEEDEDEDTSFEQRSEHAQKVHNRTSKILDALVWTIAAPHKTSKRIGLSSTADHAHRKSLGYWLGAMVPISESKAHHHRASSEIVLVQRHPPLATSNPSFLPPDQHPWRDHTSRRDYTRTGFRSTVDTVQGVCEDRNPIDPSGLSDNPIAHPTFILPDPDSSEHGLFNSLRLLASSSPPSSSSSVWSPLLSRIHSFASLGNLLP